MFIDFSQLESINELTTQNPKPMLTTDQIEKLELCRDWIQDVSFSDEFMSSADYVRQLNYALAHIDKVLKENQPCDYIHSPQIKPLPIKRR